VPFETLAEVARAGRPRSYLAGEEVRAEAAGQQDLLVLETGVLAVEGPGGTALLRAPACLGEAALVGEPAPWPRITAAEDARIWFLRAALFQELCHDHPEMAIELCKLLARRVREANGSAPASG
jgi:CRP-like cAMP-binding protein